MINTAMNKEVLWGVEPRGLNVIETQKSPRKETVIFDRTSFQLEEIRREIFLMEPAQMRVDAPVLSSPQVVEKTDSQNRWKNVFNLRKMKMVN
jgi:hypothetical protein